MAEEHPFWTELKSTHQDVRLLHPLLDLLEQPENGGEDPLMILADLLARIDARLASIEEALSISSTEPVAL